MGLAAAADRRIGTYDAEERQRLGLAQALVAQPDILLLDDPVAGLDEAGRHDLLEVIGKLRGEATVVVATRSIADVEAACDQVAVLREGRVLVAGTVGVVLGRFAPAALELDVDQGAGLAFSGLLARLRAEPWVRDVSSNGEGVRITVSDEERSARELLPSIVATGLTIGTMRRVRPELDELLLRVDAAADGQAGARS